MVLRVPPAASVPLSVCVIAFNREDLVGTVLRGASFAEEVVVFDKSSTDRTAEIASAHADRVVIVPWSPTVEETRASAIAACRHDWVLLLDDDELLTPETGAWIAAMLEAPAADIYEIALRNYVLGQHDERAYYWPEWHARLFRRDAMAVTEQVHAGLRPLSPRIARIPVDSGVCIHHLSHATVQQWVEKTNRYTSRLNRVRMDDGTTDLADFAHRAIDRWRSVGQPGQDDYPAAVALARAIYDMVDRLKVWEEENAPHGAARFRTICDEFDAAYAAAGLGRTRGAPPAEIATAAPAAQPPPACTTADALRTALRDLRTSFAARLREAEAHAAAEIAQLRQERDRRVAAALQRSVHEQRLNGTLATAAAARQTTIEELEKSVARLAERNDAILRSTSWKVTAPIRRLATAPRPAARLGVKIARALLTPWRLPARLRDRAARRREAASFAQQAAPIALTYREWLDRYETFTAADEARIREQAAAADVPDVLIVCTVEASRSASALVERLAAQMFGRWRAVLVLGPDAGATAIADPRIATVQRGDAVAAARHAPRPGECVVLLEETALPRPHALAVLAAAATPGIALVYADEDAIDDLGERSAPFFKPDFAPELLRHLDYLSGCTLLAGPTDQLRQAFATIAESGATAPTLLAAAEALDRASVRHVPAILHHARGGERRRDRMAAERDLPDDELPRISIIIPTRDRLDLLAPCLSSITRRTAYPREQFEIIVVDNGSMDPDTIEYLEALTTLGEIRVLRDVEPFNYARLNNRAAAIATGDLLVFVNNDTLVDEPRWLRLLAAQAIRPDVGVVGAKLLYPDRTVQHGGIVIGVEGVAAHVDVGAAEDHPGYFGMGNATREVAAATGACLAIRRDLFDSLGGFEEHLKVAFNDVVLALDAGARGYRNLCIATPLLLHFESRSRGFDDTPEKQAVARREAIFARRRHPHAFRDDRCYSPNLGLIRPYDLALPPRRLRPWRAPARRGEPLRLLLLSVTHEVGHGVAVVLDMHARTLAGRGHRVIVGGPRGRREMPYAGCERAILDTAEASASFAIEADIDCVVAHTPPFYSAVRWLGEAPRFIAYDYGEPPPELFPDAAERRNILREKRFCFATADRVFAISDAVREEADDPTMEIMPLGNAHLAVWNEALVGQRDAVRAKHGWQDRLVVLNVCRFHRSERGYKGIDGYIAILDRLRADDPALAARAVFVLCGKADEDDIVEMRRQGLAVFANVTDTEMVGLYAAADLYLNMSRWEGYNLGIGQALALGLPVLASDIPAHRAFPAFTSDDPGILAAQLGRLAAAPPERRAVVFDWDEPLRRFADAIEAVSAAAPFARPSHPG